MNLERRLSKKKKSCHCTVIAMLFRLNSIISSYHAQQFNCSLNFYVDLEHAVMHRKTD